MTSETCEMLCSLLSRYLLLHCLMLNQGVADTTDVLHYIGIVGCRIIPSRPIAHQASDLGPPAWPKATECNVTIGAAFMLAHIVVRNNQRIVGGVRYFLEFCFQCLLGYWCTHRHSGCLSWNSHRIFLVSVKILSEIPSGLKAGGGSKTGPHLDPI